MPRRRFRPATARIPRALCVAVFLAVAGLPVPLPLAAEAIVPRPGPIRDDWYVIELGGNRCGHMRSRVTRVGREIHTRAEMKFSLRRDRTNLEISLTQSYRETLDGRPLAFEQETVMAGQPIRQRGEVRGKRIRVTTQQFGPERSKTYPFDPDVKFLWGQWLEQQRRGLEPGTRYTIRTYEPSLREDRAFDSDIEVLGRETLELGGRKHEAVRVRITARLDAPLPSEALLDEEGIPLATEMNFGFVRIRIVRADRDDALRPVDAGRPELFLSTLVTPRGRLDRDARELVLQISAKEGELPDFPETDMQRGRRIDARTVELTVRRIDWEALRAEAARPADVPAPIARQYLKASPYLDITDPLIIELSQRGAAGARTAPERADALRRFVTDYVEEKSLGVAFATASEVAKTREGDCTEHAVLLAALARAAGLPARTVAGIVAVPARSGHGVAFGYHMWTQVFIAGRWIDIDAALRQTDCDPTHVALALMPMNQEGILEGAMAFVPLLGRLEIEITACRG